MKIHFCVSIITVPGICQLLPLLWMEWNGCIWAPTFFFSFFHTNSRVKSLSDSRFHPPPHGLKSSFNFSFIRMMPFCSLWSNIGLRGYLLSGLALYCDNKLLSSNYSKPAWNPCRLNGNPIEQVSSYKYLAVVFHSSGCWHTQVENALGNAQRRVSALIRFFFIPQEYYISPQLFMFFLVKVITQQIYGPQLCAYGNCRSCKDTQTKLLRVIFAVSHCVPNIALCLEMGLISLEVRVWIYRINYWLKPFPPSLWDLCLLH